MSREVVISLTVMKAASICDPCDRCYDKYTVFNSLYRFVVKINQVCEFLKYD